MYVCVWLIKPYHDCIEFNYFFEPIRVEMLYQTGVAAIYLVPPAYGIGFDGLSIDTRFNASTKCVGRTKSHLRPQFRLWLMYSHRPALGQRIRIHSTVFAHRNACLM